MQPPLYCAEATEQARAAVARRRVRIVRKGDEKSAGKWDDVSPRRGRSQASPSPHSRTQTHTGKATPTDRRTDRRTDGRTDGHTHEPPHVDPPPPPLFLNRTGGNTSRPLSLSVGAVAPALDEEEDADDVDEEGTVVAAVVRRSAVALGGGLRKVVCVPPCAIAFIAYRSCTAFRASSIKSASSSSGRRRPLRLALSRPPPPPPPLVGVRTAAATDVDDDDKGSSESDPAPNSRSHASATL